MAEQRAGRTWLIVLGVVERLVDFTIFSGGFGLLFWPTLAASVTVATLSYYLLERPIMRLGRRRRSSETTGPNARGEHAITTPVSTSA